MSDVTGTTETASGLEDVVAATTRLSEVDGKQGRLILVGKPLEEICANWSFERLAFELLETASTDSSGEPRDRKDGIDTFREHLGRARQEAFDGFTEDQGTRSRLFGRDDPMEALRAALASMASRGEDRADTIRVLGAVPVASALWHGERVGEKVHRPDPSAGHARDYLRMVSGTAPDADRAGGLETYLMAVADHGLNASTFTARVITSTGSDLVSAVVGAVGALKGPLHGGAPGPVLDMLDAVGSPEYADRWIQSRLEADERVMGMGHRVYRVRDPRAAVFERTIGRLDPRPDTDDRLKLARAVEESAERQLAERHPDRELRANVEFYTAVLLEAVGMPRDLFSPTFAAGRTAGWAAHVAEQRRSGRLIRPRSRYVGSRPENLSENLSR